MNRRTPKKKTVARKAKTMPAGPKKLGRKEMRFSISLVILIGMLTFSLLLLLVSLNKPSIVKAGTQAAKTIPTGNIAPKKADNRVVDDNALGFRLTVPARLDQWFYRIGEVKSLTDDSLSNQYVQIFVPVPGSKSSNFEDRNRNILTIRKFSEDEWDDAAASCKKNKKDICDPAGTLIRETTDSEGDSWAYAYTKPGDCPKSIEAKCALADKIIESFQIK